MQPGLIARVSAPGMFGAETEDFGQAIPIQREEETYVANSAAVRRRDFALGRFCARSALAQMGINHPHIARGQDGAPVWPQDIVGSITHTSGYAAAIVGSGERFLGMGVDAERIGGVTEQLFPKLFDGDERAMLAALDPEQRRLTSTIFFSAKEAYFKAWRPGKPLSFKDIHIALNGRGFRANEDQGHIAICGDLVVTAVLLPVH